MSSFLYSGTYKLFVKSEKIVKINISCPDQFQKAKDLIGKGHTKTGRYDPKDHLKFLQESGSLNNPENPTLVCGIRNVMSNYRCIVYTEGNISPDQDPPYSVEGEIPLLSKRPYYIIGEDKTSGKIILEEYIPSQGDITRFRWLFSGVPVLWDDIKEKELFQKILTEASDHSHVYNLPRGNHPEATEETISNWKELHNAFIESIYDLSEVAFKKLHKIARNKKLKREYKYTHSIIGIDDNNNILILISGGKLEKLGKEIKKLGAKRAICVENSGSITLLYYPNGISGNEISLFSLPNQRRAGTAFMTIELKDNYYSFFT